MSYQLENKMVIGISARALFDMSYENEIFETKGLEAYRKYQVAHEKDVLKPGPGFGLVKSLLSLNQYTSKEGYGGDYVEVVIMSRNSADTSLRVFHSIEHYGLHITRAALVSGASLAPYLAAFHIDLFLSAYEDDVQYAIDNGIAAGVICTETVKQNDGAKVVWYKNTERMLREGSDSNASCEQIRIAFDGDAVLFTDESEQIFQSSGLEAFEANEKKNAGYPLHEGPFANFLRKLSALQDRFPYEECPIRTALVTARSAPAHERVIRTLRAWNVRLDEAFFLGGVEKKDFLKAFGAQIFFDDQSVHTISAATVVPAARVPYRRRA